MAPFFHVFRYFGCQRGEGLLVNTDSATMSRPSMLDGGPYDAAPEPGGFEIDFRVLWVILRRNLLLIGSIVADALVLGPVVTMLMTPRYTAPASMQDRKSVAQGKSASVRIDTCGRRLIKKANKHTT